MSSKNKSQTKILKKRGPDIDPCVTPDATLYSLNTEQRVDFNNLDLVDQIALNKS